MNKKVLAVLIGIAFVSTLLTIFQKSPTPPCFNADEAAFGYNAYSLLKTGRDEYGTLLPLRLKSFGDYKMPLYSYLSIPFIALFGLNELGVRGLNIFLSFLFPFAIYLLSIELFKKKSVGLVAALFCSVSLGLHIISRQAHEAYLAAFLTTLASYFFLKVLHAPKLKQIFYFLSFSILLLFSYHPGRLFVVTFFCYSLFDAFIRKQKKFILPFLLLLVIALFSLTDLAYKPERLKNLAFFNNEGYKLKITELKTEGGIRYLYNPVLISFKDILLDHFTYFSPQFLITNGDENNRFGYAGMSIMTPLEYIFFLMGLYYLFKHKQQWRWYLVALLFISPLSASLAWSKGSLTRALFLLVPILITSAYGGVFFLEEIKKKYRLLAVVFTALLFGIFLMFSWDFYLFHYSKRLVTIHAWQCGYSQVGSYIKTNYDKYDRFYITRDIGMPYIFILYYLKYPPDKYQLEASLTPSDEYGFGQVERFDKFFFNFTTPDKAEKGSVIIGSIDNFKGLSDINSAKLQTIAVNGEPMFQIYEIE